MGRLYVICISLLFAACKRLPAFRRDESARTAQAPNCLKRTEQQTRSSLAGDDTSGTAGAFVPCCANLKRMGRHTKTRGRFPA